MKHKQETINEILELHKKGISSRDIAEIVIGRRSAKSSVNDIIKKYKETLHNEVKKPSAKILFLDIETAPIFGAVWSLWKQNVGLNQIQSDWFILSYAAKWIGEDKPIIYEDLQGDVKSEDDTLLLDNLWDLLDEADIVVGHNCENFDIKKINARFVLNGYTPPSNYKVVDTCRIAKKRFGFTSNKLEYLTDKLCTKYKKSKHKKFAGFDLWKECLAENPEAWEEMEEYNIMDVLSLEELYLKLQAWDKDHPSLNMYTDLEEVTCDCGCNKMKSSGYHYTKVSKFTKYQCVKCGTEYRDRTNILSKDQRQKILVRI